MDKEELIQAIQDLDTEVSSSCEILMVGGAAMILYFGAQRATRDVDAILLDGDNSQLQRGVKAVARRRGLPDDWMQDAVKGFAGILPADFHDRLVQLDLSLQRIRLWVLGRPDQVAMKMAGLREQDLEDLEVLLPQMSEADKEVLIRIIHHVGTFRPDWAQRMQYFLLEKGWKIE
jgi:hypothetical protein